MPRVGQAVCARPGGISGLLRLLALVLALLGGAVPLQAQEAAQPTPVLTLDFERLFQETLWGQRIARELAEASEALNAENNRIAEDLIAEEKALTARRETLPPEVFRAEADAFDDRATAIRAAQKAKAQSLSQTFEAARQEFFEATAPLMDDLLAGRGAVMVLDRRAIIRALEAADITDDLVGLVDARLGAGPAAPPPASTPATPEK